MLSWLRSEKVDHPLANAKEAKRIADEFPYKDAQKTIEDASYWITSVNETPEFRWDKRFEVLSLLDTATRKCQDQLLVAYVTLPDNDRTQEKRLWKICTDFWSALGSGYLACVDQAAQPKAVSGSLKPQTPVLAARALRALRQQLKWTLMRYSIVRTGTWQDVARCVAFAEAQGVIKTSAAIYGGNDNTPCDEFLRAMMLWAASPSGLSPVEQDVAERIVTALTPKFKFDVQAWDGCDYCFDLDASRPPLRLTRSTPVSVATRYFDGSDAHQAVQTMFSSLSSTGDIPRGFDPGPVADLAMIGRVLRHLQINWAKVMPSRAHERRRTAAGLSVVHGYTNVLRTLNPEASGGLDFAAPAAPESWVAEDVSVGGFGVVVPAGRGEWLRVGMLLALRTETDAVWSLGVIRRVKADEHRQHRIGVQLISKSPMPLMLRTLAAAAQGRKAQGALLLSSRPSPNGSLHVMASRDLLTGREALEAVYGEPPATVQFDAGGVVESGHDFDWLRYKLLASLT